MDKENQDLETKFKEDEVQLHKQKEEELAELNKPIKLFDYEREAKFGSSWHIFMLSQMRTVLVPNLIQRIQSVSVPPTEEEMDGGKLGRTLFTIGKLEVVDMIIPVNQTHITFNPKSITIVWNNVCASLKDFEWKYRKETFPKLKDKGMAYAGIEGAIICAVIHLERDPKTPKLTIESTAISISDIKFKISGSTISMLYNAIANMVAKLAKPKVQLELQKVIQDFFENMTNQLIPKD